MLVVDGLDVFYGRVQVLRGVALRVERGELVTIVGPNGAGKTTLLRAIAGLIPIRSGRLSLDGRALGGARAEELVRRGIVMVPEGRELFGPLTVSQNLSLGAYSLPRAVRRRWIAQGLGTVLALFPTLATRLAQHAGTLSGGEQQMVALGRALMARPRVLLLDEPSIGLAPLVVREIFRAIEILKAEGLTVLLVEQNARAAFRIADRGYVLRPGGLIAEAGREGAGADSARDAYGFETAERSALHE